MESWKPKEAKQKMQYEAWSKSPDSRWFGACGDVRFFWGVLHCCIAWFILHVFSKSTEQYALCQLWLPNLAKIIHPSIASTHLSIASVVLITTLYVRCHHQLRMIPERSLFLLHVYVPINFGKDPPSLAISSTKITKWVRGDVASSTTRTCCRSPVAFLAQSNEESDVWWGVRGKSEYDEGFPKQLAVIPIAGRRCS